jgi:F-type H+-transporting ATPase subunit gamma
MADLKTLKLRIGSIAKTKKITQAMKMVSASKLRKAREAAENNRPYTAKLWDMVTNIASSSAGELINEKSLLHGSGKQDTILYIVITSDRGLCGGLNSNIVKYVKKQVAAKIAEGKQLKIIAIGKKGFEQLENHCKENILNYREGFSSRPISNTEIDGITAEIIDLFENGGFDECHLIYAKFITAMSQEVGDKKIIPLEFEASVSTQTEIEYEPSKEKCLDKLLPANIAAQIQHAVLETYASEQGARMTAMDNAVKNSEELTKNLKVLYNRTRQAKITTELIEIISAVESM